MKYLLSNGIVSTNSTLYLKDILSLNLSMLPQDVPFNKKIGLDTLILVPEENDFLDIVRTRIAKLLTELSYRYGVEFSLSSVELELNNLKIEVVLNHSESLTYNIPKN